MKFAVESGIINLQDVQKRIDMIKREELLSKHQYNIWEGSDGKWHTYLPDEEKGRIPRKRNTKKEIEDVVVCYWQKELENPTIKEVFEEWNNRKLDLKKIKESTHLRNIQIFNRHYSDFGSERIKAVSTDDIQEFLEEQIPKFDLTAKSFSNLKSITRGFLKRAKKRKLISYNIEELFNELDTSEKDFRKVVKEDYEEVFDEEETDKIIDYLIKNLDVHNRAILLMFVSGIRVGELVTLKHSDFESNTFKIRRTETRFKNEKGEYELRVEEFPKSEAGVRTAIIPLGYEWLVKSIKLLNPFGEYIFCNNGKRLSAQAIRMRLKRVCRKLNIYHKSPHKIRKTYGTILLDNHVDNQTVIGLMGHTEILCTEEHYHRNRKTIEAKTKVLSAIPDFIAK